MTEASHRVTSSALAAFAREYLTARGATIEEDGNRWRVRLPADAVSGIDDREFEVRLDEDDEDTRLLAPGSEFAQQLLDAATATTTVGRIALTEGSEHQYPPWLTESDAELVATTFSPYYDRTAVCVFVTLGVETVSEYQTQFLETVMLDADSKEPLPGITDWLLETWYAPKDPPSRTTAESDGSIRRETLTEVAAAGQHTAMENRREAIAEIRRSASRAAAAEFDEYRRLQEQRIAELGEESSALASRLQDTSADDAASQHQRVERLEKRQQLKRDKEAAERERDRILEEKRNGYAKKRREIDDRHAIEVTTAPVGLAVVTYERGDIELTVSEHGRTASIRAPYAVGVGVTDDIRCGNCCERLSGDNPVRLTTTGIGCQRCHD